MPLKQHHPVGYKPYDKQAHDATRKSAARRGYGWKWQIAANGYRQMHPCCVECSKNGIQAPGSVVDHIIPHKGDVNLFWDQSNWQTLCRKHHSQKTAAEDGGFGNRQKHNVE